MVSIGHDSGCFHNGQGRTVHYRTTDVRHGDSDKVDIDKDPKAMVTPLAYDAILNMVVDSRKAASSAPIEGGAR
jgi:hypothetical protein